MKRTVTVIVALAAVSALAVAGCSSYRTENDQRDTLEQIIRAIPPVLDGTVGYGTDCVSINIDCTDVGWNAAVTTGGTTPGRACRAFNRWASDNDAEVQLVTRRGRGMTPGTVSASDLVDDEADVKSPYRAATFAEECRKALEADGFAAVQGSVTPFVDELGLSEAMDDLGLSDLYTAGLMWDQTVREATANVRIVG
jgi:hypothetical protein